MGVKNIIGGTFEDVGEAVVKPVIDEVGKALETGVRSVVQGPPSLDPKQQAKKEEERQKKIAAWRWKIAQQSRLAEVQRKVREEAKQKEVQRVQEYQAVKEKKQTEDLESFKKKQDINLAKAQRKTEIKGGVGG